MAGKKDNTPINKARHAVGNKNSRSARAARAPRHLVRWNESTDRRLLLAIQSACNKKKVELPWDLISAHIGNGATPGAITQHLSKVRARMQEQGLDVPPPLRRGGMRSNTSLSTTSNNTPKAKSTRFTTRDVSEETIDEAGLERDPESSYEPQKMIATKRPSRAQKVIKEEEMSDNDKKLAVGSRFLDRVSPSPLSESSSSSTILDSGSDGPLVYKIDTNTRPKVRDFLKTEQNSSFAPGPFSEPQSNHDTPQFHGYSIDADGNPANYPVPAFSMNNTGALDGPTHALAGSYGANYYPYPTISDPASAYTMPPPVPSTPFASAQMPFEGQLDGLTPFFDQQYEAGIESYDQMVDGDFYDFTENDSGFGYGHDGSL